MTNKTELARETSADQLIVIILDSIESSSSDGDVQYLQIKINGSIIDQYQSENRARRAFAALVSALIPGE